MEEVSIIGIDLAKRSFQVHGAKADASVAYRRKLSRGKPLSFLASQAGCTVAMEACTSAHYWGREIAALGHEVRLVPPVYAKPFVKRQNDAADAEAITEAAQRPTMHFVAVKSEAQQAQAMLFHTRDLLVRQRTQTINALRGHLAEYGIVAPQGRARIRDLVAVLEAGDCGLPKAVVELGRLLLGRIDELDEKINGLDRELRTSARENEETACLMTIPAKPGAASSVQNRPRGSSGAWFSTISTPAQSRIVTAAPSARAPPAEGPESQPTNPIVAAMAAGRTGNGWNHRRPAKDGIPNPPVLAPAAALGSGWLRNEGGHQDPDEHREHQGKNGTLGKHVASSL